MKKIGWFVFVLILIYTNANSQITFVKRYTIPGALPWGSSIVEDAGSGYLFTGNSYDTLTELTYSFLAKCDPLGAISWVKYYDTLIYNTAVERFSNGDLLLAGGKSVMKLDNSGNVIWSKRILGISNIPNGSIISSDGGIVISAISQVIGDFSLQLLKLDSTGNLIWSMETPTSSNSILWSKIIETADGGFLTVFCKDVGNLYLQIFLIKTDVAGNMSWSNSFGSTYSDFSSDVLQSVDGNYLIAGYMNGECSMLKVDTLGTLMWSKSYGSNSIGIQKILEKPNGNLILAGTIRDSIYNDNLVMETNANGDILFSRSYSAIISGNIYDIKATSDLGYIAVCNDGIVDPAILNVSDYIIELIKMDSLLESACNSQVENITSTNQNLSSHLGTYLLPGSVMTNSIVINDHPYLMNTDVVCKSINVDDFNIDNLIDLYPNPSTNNLNIEIISGLIQKIEIVDLSGKQVKTLSCNNSKLEIDISNLSSGIYFLNGISDQRVFRKKFVKN